MLAISKQLLQCLAWFQYLKNKLFGNKHVFEKSLYDCKQFFKIFLMNAYFYIGQKFARSYQPSLLKLITYVLFISNKYYSTDWDSLSPILFISLHISYIRALLFYFLIVKSSILYFGILTTNSQDVDFQSFVLANKLCNERK